VAGPAAEAFRPPEERALIDEYRALMEKAMAGLTPESYQRAAKLAFRDNIGACAKLGQRADDSLVRICLQGVADHRVQRRECIRKDLEVTRQRCRRITVERRSDGRSDVGHRHILRMQHTVAVVEMVHGRFPVEWE